MITRELFLTVRNLDAKLPVKELSTGPLTTHVLVEEDGTLAEYGKEYVTREGVSVRLRDNLVTKPVSDEPDVWLIVEGVGEDARCTPMLPQWLGLMWRPL